MTDTNTALGSVALAGNRWRKATLVGVHSQSWHSRTLDLHVPGWTGHLPGQHVDIRLTAADGYSAQRSYSLAEPATPDRVAITVDLLPHGEVSPYLVETMEIGDELDVRGPIGGWFVWEPGDPSIGDGPVLLIAGGSGVVPLVTMVRARKRAGDPTRTMLVYSLRGRATSCTGPSWKRCRPIRPRRGSRTCASSTRAGSPTGTSVPPDTSRSRTSGLRPRGRSLWRPGLRVRPLRLRRPRHTAAPHDGIPRRSHTYGTIRSNGSYSMTSDFSTPAAPGGGTGPVLDGNAAAA